MCKSGLGSKKSVYSEMLTYEVYILLAAVVLGLVHLSAASFSFMAQVGNKYSVGARDENIQPTGIAGRLNRAQKNFMETFPFFAVLVVLGYVSGISGSFSIWGSTLYIVGRLLFLPLYALGTPWLRTFSWNIATLGLVLLLVQLFQ